MGRGRRFATLERAWPHTCVVSGVVGVPTWEVLDEAMVGVEMRARSLNVPLPRSLIRTHSVSFHVDRPTPVLRFNISSIFRLISFQNACLLCSTQRNTLKILLQTASGPNCYTTDCATEAKKKKRTIIAVVVPSHNGSEHDF